MSWHRVDLGAQSFSSTNANLQLAIQASANLTNSTSSAVAHDFPSQLPSSLWNIWVAKAHNLHFSFSFSFQPCLQISQHQQAALLESIRSSLESAELWRQLSLNATIASQDVPDPSNPVDEQSVRLLLHDSLISKKEGPRGGSSWLSRGDREVSNLQPPDSVPCHLLSSIKVRFLVTSISGPDPVTSELVKPPSSSRMSPGKVLGMMPVVSSESLLSLIDAALRGVFCPRPIRTSPGIKPIGAVPHNYLADIAPIIFVPGYGTNVAERAHLVPSVAKILASFFVGADNNVARTKLRGILLQDAQADLDFIEPKSRNTNTVALKAIFSRHLWLTLSNSLRTMEATRRLKPFRPPEGDSFVGTSRYGGQEIFTDEHMFDSPTYTSYSVASKFDQMLLGTGEEESFENESALLFDLYDASLTTSMTPAATELVDCHYDDELMEYCYPMEPSYVEMLEYYPDSSSDAENMLSSAHSAADAVYGRTSPGTEVKHISATENDPEAAIEMPRIGVIHSAELADSAAQGHAAILGAIGECTALTEPLFRQHPVVAQNTINDSEGTTDSLFEETDNQEFEEAQDYRPSNTPLKRIQIGSILSDSPGSQREDNYSIVFDMPSETKSTGSSLSDILGGDHLLWQMWKRRASATPMEEDILEMHAMYSGDPDMRLLTRMKTTEEIREDEEMLDEDLPTSSSNSSVKSPSSEYGAFPFTRRQSTDRSPASRPKSSSSIDPTTSKSRSRPSQSFIKRLSWGGSSSSRTSVDTQVQNFISSQPREMEIKRRKTLEDYEMTQGGDEMLLG